MKSQINYLELKSGFSNDGPAWIGLVVFSKTGKTLYFDGKAFQRIGSDRMNGNFYDIESGDEYWISGVKKNQQDRHNFGKGLVYVEKRILGDYLHIVNQKGLDTRLYELVQVNVEIPILRVNEIENQKVVTRTHIDENKQKLARTELSLEELDYFIELYKEDSINGHYLKGRKWSRNLMNELIVERANRK